MTCLVVLLLLLLLLLTTGVGMDNASNRLHRRKDDDVWCPTTPSLDFENEEWGNHADGTVLLSD